MRLLPRRRPRAEPPPPRTPGSRTSGRRILNLMWGGVAALWPFLIAVFSAIEFGPAFVFGLSFEGQFPWFELTFLIVGTGGGLAGAWFVIWLSARSKT